MPIYMNYDAIGLRAKGLSEQGARSVLENKIPDNPVDKLQLTNAQPKGTISARLLLPAAKQTSNLIVNGLGGDDRIAARRGATRARHRSNIRINMESL